GGVYVAAGDLTGDGRADIIVAPDSGARPLVRVFDGKTGAEIRSFLAFSATYTGGVTVAAGDVNGDGVDDIITGAAINGHVKVFDGVSGAEIRSFFAFPGFTGGVSVAAGDTNGDGFAEVLAGASTSVPHVKAFDGASGAEVRSFFALPGFSGGVTVAGGDRNADGRAD